MTPADVADLLAQLGGRASSRELSDQCGRHAVREALRVGAIVKAARNRVCLPEIESALLAAEQVAGVVGLRSAALLHHWKVLREPESPEIFVPAGRRLPAYRRHGLLIHWSSPEQVVDSITGPEQTVMDCAKYLPFDEALTVCDSALRAGAVSERVLFEMAEQATGRGRGRLLRVVTHASKLAASPIESALRAIAIDAGLMNSETTRLYPQHEIDLGDYQVHADLGAPGCKLAVEAEGFEFHGQRQALLRDCRRYTEFAAAGWGVVRYCWEDIMFQQNYVTATLLATARMQVSHLKVAAKSRRRPTN